MNSLIAGASGFIGTELVKVLASEHMITVLGRDIHLLQLDATNFDAVINLCGHTIAASRWNKHVDRILAKTLQRPLLLKLPAKIIQVLLGDMGDCLLLRGQRVIPKRLIAEGYQFAYPQCADALKQELQ